jgi:hypothetical protein
MKNVQAFVQKVKARATMPRSRRVGLLALYLIIGVLLVACGGGSTPPDQSTDTPAASQSSAKDQEEVSGTEEDQDELPSTEEDQDEVSGTEEDQDEVSGTEEDQDELPGTEEFGLTEEELVAKIEAVEALIAPCMSNAGFEYVPVDYATVRQAMDADKSAPGLSTEEYVATYGYGISTQPELAGVKTPATIGLGEQNMQIFNSLSEADQDAYNHTLFGENTDATFAVSLEAEDFSETGGCTRAAIEQVFSPEELSAAYYNPGDALIEQDPRVIAAIAAWSDCMREAGFDYDSPEEIESDLEDRLDAILDGADFEELSAPAQAELTELQGEERATAVADLECELEFIEPAVRQVETELYGAPQP